MGTKLGDTEGAVGALLGETVGMAVGDAVRTMEVNDCS